MELWIRSQDKSKLVKVNYLYIMNYHVSAETLQAAIVGETIDSGPVIARYKTQKRALEVLNEIQDILECIHTTDQEYKRELVVGGNMFYEMPEE